MDTVKEFFNHINIRLSSPLIFSFVISWLFCNWQVPVVLFFYSQTDLLIQGDKGYIDFIVKHVSTWSGVVLPSLLALMYTMGSPGVTMLVKALQTFFDKKSDDWNIEIVKGSSIPIDKYLTLRKALLSREESLEEIIKKESGLSNELEETRNELHILKNQESDLNKLRNDYRNLLQDFNRLKSELSQPESLEHWFKGRWIWEFNLTKGRDLKQPHMGFEEVIIKRDEYIANDNLRFAITDIKFISSLEVLSFSKKMLEQADAINNVILIKAGMDLWVGIEKTYDGNLGYIRMYPKNKEKMPLHFPLIIPGDYLEDFNIFAEYKNALVRGISKIKS